MQPIPNWSEYWATAGTRYSFTFALAEGSGTPNGSNLSIVRQYFDSRPGVDVGGVSKGADGAIVVDIIVLRSGPLLSVVGGHVNDGSDRYYSVANVIRTDDGGGNGLTAAMYRFADWITDPFDKFAEESKRATMETAKDVALFGVPSALLLGGAALFLVAWTKS